MIGQLATWHQVTTPTSKDLNCIVFPSPQVGYIGCTDSVLLKTTDGGKTWNKLSYAGITFLPGGDDFLELDFITENIGFATVGPYSGTYRTDDGGLNWTLLSTSLCYNQGLYFTADGEGFVGGSGCFQGEKIDRFSSGTSAPATLNTPTWDASNMIVDIDFDLSVFAAAGIAVSKGGHIFRTTDGGFNWDSIPSSLAFGVPLTSVTIVNSNLAYIGYDDSAAGFGLLKSTDGGLNWSMDINTATFYYPTFNDLHTTPQGRVYVGATPSSVTTGLIMESVDTSVWNLYNVDLPIYSISSYNDTIIWGAGKNGYLVTTANPNVLSINNVSLQESVRLYPNPANTEINIVFPSSDNTQIEISNAMGQLLVKDQNKNTFDISNLTNGVYFITVKQGQQSYTQKIIKQ